MADTRKRQQNAVASAVASGLSAAGAVAAVAAAQSVVLQAALLTKGGGGAGGGGGGGGTQELRFAFGELDSLPSSWTDVLYDENYDFEVPYTGAVHVKNVGTGSVTVRLAAEGDSNLVLLTDEGEVFSVTQLLEPGEELQNGLGNSGIGFTLKANTAETLYTRPETVSGEYFVNGLSSSEMTFPELYGFLCTIL